MSLAQTKVCPLCGRKFGPQVEVCPSDGRLLVSDQESSGPVRLSSAAEQLLGNLLSPSTRPKPEEAATHVGPPPFADAITPGMESGVEVTVSNAVNPLAVHDLGNPLAELEPSDEFTLIDEPFQLEPSDDKAEALAALNEAAAQKSRRRLLTDLQMEYQQLQADVSDDEVTLRVERTELVEEGPRLNELPDEEEITTAEPMASEKVEIAPSLQADLDALKAPVKSQRPAFLYALVLVFVAAVGAGIYWLLVR